MSRSSHHAVITVVGGGAITAIAAAICTRLANAVIIAILAAFAPPDPCSAAPFRPKRAPRPCSPPPVRP